MAKDSFCLDIGESTIKIADVMRDGNFFHAGTLAMFDIDAAFFRTDSEKVIEDLAENLLKIISKLGIKKRTVHVIIPDTYSYSRFIDMPKLNEKELLTAIKYQADQFIPMPLDETNIDIEVVYENERSKKILTLISAAPKKIIEKIEKLIGYAGLTPDSIETEISATSRLASEIFKKTPAQGAKSEGLLLINMNLSSTSVYFFDQALGIVTFNHNFNIGYNLFIKEIQVNLNVEYAKAAELLRTFGVSQNSSYKLDVVLNAALHDFISEIQRSISLLTEKNNSVIRGIYSFNDALKFHELEQVIGKQFGVTSTLLDIYPYFSKNAVVDSIRQNLAYFIPSIGGNLK